MTMFLALVIRPFFWVTAIAVTLWVARKILPEKVAITLKTPITDILKRLLNQLYRLVRR